MAHIRSSLCSAVVVALLSCGGGDESPAGPVPGPPVKLVVLSGDGQSSVIGTFLPIAPTVVAKDANGYDVPAVAVAFQVVSGGGRFSGGQTNWESITDAGGVATASVWILGPNEGANTMTALATGVPSITVHATALRGTNSTLTLDRPSVTAGEPVTVAVEVKDSDGHVAVGAIPSTIALSSKLLGRFDPVTCTNGRCVTTYAPTAAGSDTVYAKIGGENVASSPVALTVLPGEAARIGIVTQPSPIAENGIALPRQPIVQLQDRFGNSVGQPGVSVTAYQVAGSGAGSLRFQNDTTRTDTAGVATFSGLTLAGPVGGGYRLTFKTSNLSGDSSEPLMVSHGPPYKLFLKTPASGPTPGGPFSVQPVLQVADAGDNLLQLSECVTASITPLAGLTGNPAITGTGTLAYTDLGLGSTTPPGSYTITYLSGCPCVPGRLLPASQSIQAP